MSAQGVYTPDLRVRWIRLNMTPEEAGVGGGTPNPIECTLDQLAEMLFRVKDAWFIGGRGANATGDPSVQPEAGFEITAPIAAPSNRAASSGDYQRGYTTPTAAGDAEVSTHNDAYLGEEYDTGGGSMFRDIGDNERGIWMRGKASEILPQWDYESAVRLVGGYEYTEVVNAFSFRQADTVDMSASERFTVNSWFVPPLTQYDLGPASVMVLFTGTVVVLTEGPDDEIYASTNRYFPSFEFYATDSSGLSGTTNGIEVGTNQASIVSGAPIPLMLVDQVTPCRFILRLPSGDVTCPLYITDITVGGTHPFTFGEDFILKFQGCFPYAKNSPPEPVWDSTTGARL